MDENMIETEINVDKIFKFPKNICIEKYKDLYLVIYMDGVCWLVLSEQEKKIFDVLASGASIAYALDRYDEEIVINVITQIIAKGFEHPLMIENEEKDMYIYLTNNCNQRCKHCYMYAGDFQFEELSPDLWKKVLHDFKENGGHGVTFTGGEVCVYPSFEAVIRYAHDLGLRVTVLSNGIGWSNDQIENLVSCIDEIQISIDGYDRDSYYAVRQSYGFDKALLTIKAFLNHGTSTSIAVTPLYDDLDQFIAHFEPFAKKLLDDYPNLMMRFNYELLEGRSIKRDEEKNKNYRHKINALVKRIYPNNELENFLLNYSDRTIRKNCGFGGISIAANGDVYWCNRIHELTSHYNIRQHSMDQIMRLSKEMTKKTDVDHTIPCKDCSIKYICGGDCRMRYIGIKEADIKSCDWIIKCPKGTKESFFEKMIKYNEYFYLNQPGDDEIE